MSIAFVLVLLSSLAGVAVPVASFETLQGCQQAYAGAIYSSDAGQNWYGADHYAGRGVPAAMCLAVPRSGTP